MNLECRQVDITQNTNDWLGWRKTRVGSSDIAAIMDASPWVNINQLWLEKTGLAESNFKPNFFTERGKELEGVALDIYNHTFKTNFQPATFELVRFPFCAGSADGFDSDLGYGLEIKCPKPSEVALAKKGIITHKYYCQINWLMMVSNSPKWHYVVIDPDDASGEIIVSEFLADRKFQRRMFWNALRFQHYVETKTPIPMKVCNAIRNSESFAVSAVPKRKSRKTKNKSV